MIDAEADRQFLKTLTLLYAEDDDDTRDQLAQFLEHRVGRLLCAANGADALETFRLANPHIVVTDIQMPGLDGLALISQIRGAGAQVPVVVLTAFEKAEYLHRAIEARVDQFVLKPIDTVQLEQTLLAIARRLRGEALLARQHQTELDQLRTHHFESLGRLAGGMAHDFNNLLQMLFFDVEQAEQLAAPGSKQQAVLAQAQNCLSRTRELSHQLLVLSSTGIAQHQRVPLPELLRTSIDSLVPPAGVVVQYLVPSDLPTLRVEAEPLRRVFLALANNAYDAMPSGGRLSVSAEFTTLSNGQVPLLATGHYLQLRFRDTGLGIAPQVLPHIFDPYFSTKPRGSVKGQGLSLALSLAVVLQHHGQMTAESPPGGGAAINLFLPVN